VTDDDLKLDTTVPHSARVWNYWLGGKDNFEPDRQLGEQIKQFFPEIAVIAQESRRFLARAVSYLAGEAGIRQFLDVGTGLPTADNTHEVAQRIAPESRIVYVDNDPLVLVHARALLTSTPEGQGPLDRPPDRRGPALGQLSGGQRRHERDRPGEAQRGHPGDHRGRHAVHLPAPDTIAGYFHDLELIEPGVVSSIRWRAEPDQNGKLPDEIDVFCGVGRKP
jgi:hypothetical protein